MIGHREQSNKDVVRRFNEECISNGSRAAFEQLVTPDFVDHTAPPGGESAQGMAHFIFDVLRVAIPNLAVEIYDQIAERDTVTTRKVFRGTFTGDLLGLAATKKPIEIDVIDIIVVRDGRLAEHWGMNTFMQAARAEDAR